MAKKEERFETIFRDGSWLKDEGIRQILVDKKTGVNYLCWSSLNTDLRNTSLFFFHFV